MKIGRIVRTIKKGNKIKKINNCMTYQVIFLYLFLKVMKSNPSKRIARKTINFLINNPSLK